MHLWHADDLRLIHVEFIWSTFVVHLNHHHCKSIGEAMFRSSLLIVNSLERFLFSFPLSLCLSLRSLHLMRFHRINFTVHTWFRCFIRFWFGYWIFWEFGKPTRWSETDCSSKYHKMVSNCLQSNISSFEAWELMQFTEISMNWIGSSGDVWNLFLIIK